MDRIAYLLPLLLVLSACAGSPVRIAADADLSPYSTTQLCETIALGHGRERLLDELERREALAPGERTWIETRQALPGMSELALLCSWGRPGPFGMVNETRTLNGMRRQYVYRSCRACPAQFVYTERGVVTAVQT